MPRIALISDTHGIEPALDAVLEDIERQRQRRGPIEIVSLGDNIGYGPHSKACQDKLRSVCSATVAGNHEEMVWRKIENPSVNLKLVTQNRAAIAGVHSAIRQLYGDKTPIQSDYEEMEAYTASLLEKVRSPDYITMLAQEIATGIDRKLTFKERFGFKRPDMLEEVLINPNLREKYGELKRLEAACDEGNKAFEWLKALPTEVVIKRDGLVLWAVHDNFESPGDGKYTIDFSRKENESYKKESHSTEEAMKSWKKDGNKVRIKAYGHSHQRCMESPDGTHWLVNPGSAGGLGRERCEPPMASYALIDTDDANFPIRIYTLDFDYTSVGEDMEAAGLANKFKAKNAGRD